MFLEKVSSLIHFKKLDEAANKHKNIVEATIRVIRGPVGVDAASKLCDDLSGNRKNGSCINGPLKPRSH